METRQTTETWGGFKMSNDLRTVTEPDREGPLQRLTAIIGLAALTVRATWTLIHWGK